MRKLSNAVVASLHASSYLTVLLLLAAVGRREQALAGIEELQRIVFKLGGTSYAIPLPKQATVGPFLGRGEGAVLVRDIPKNARLQRTLIVALTEDGSSYDHTKVLANGARFDYRQTDNAGGGSGGPIAELKARLAIGGKVLFVECTDQDEWDRKPDWCVPFIEHLEISR